MTSSIRPLTWFGLFLSLLGIPIVVNVFRYFYGDVHSNLQFVGKEALVFGLVVLLLLIVTRGERQPLSSIGLHFKAPLKSLLWGLLGVVLFMIGLACALLVIKLAGLGPLGSHDDNPYQPPVWALVLTVLRAGIAEEICFRGYAIERLQAITRNKWLATLLPLAFFTASHFRLGLAGMLVALVGGIILTALYWWRRDLLANIITHSVVDFIPNVLLPLLGMGH